MTLYQRAELETWTMPFCPQPGTWTLDWEGIVAEYPCVAAMAGCWQDPRWHAEGDVLIHTRRVCEALTAMDAWRNLPATARSIVFAAALFHDVGKPACTRVEEDGSITSKGHSNRGVSLVRQLFYRDGVAPLACRESICALVRHHGVPLGFLNKNPDRAAILASVSARCDWLSLVALADAMGRECAERGELISRVELFQELCAERDCLRTPRTFASPHSRFVFARTDDALAGYEAYDDSRFDVILMSGLPGAGKDEWVRQNCAGMNVISLDELRESMNVAPEDEQGTVVAAAKERAREFARAAQPFVWNATNVSRDLRGGLVRLLAGYKARVRIVYLETPYEELLKRNRTRPKPVPTAVINRLIEKLDVPDLSEAHFVEWICNG